MSPDTRRAMLRVAHDHAEHARVAVRHVRQRAMAAIKGASKAGLGEDERKKLEKLVDALTKSHITDIDAALVRKERELQI
jgi:ribosome recycling factor